MSPRRSIEYTCGKLATAVSEKPSRQERINTIRTIGALSTVGFSFVLAVAIGTLAGYFLDRALGFEKVFFLIGFALGVIAGILNVFRASKNLK